MRIAATLDPERLRDIMHDLFNRSAAVVQRYQGTVDKCVIEEELDNGSVHYTSGGLSLLIQLLLERDASGDLEQARHVLTRFEEMVEPVPRPRQESRRPGSPDRRRAARR